MYGQLIKSVKNAKLIAAILFAIKLAIYLFMCIKKTKNKCVVSQECQIITLYLLIHVYKKQKQMCGQSRMPNNYSI